MGLSSYRGAKVRKQDITIAKNYLSEDELAALNNLVEQYLIFAEGQAMRRIPMHMGDWIKKLDGFLTINDRDILNCIHKGLGCGCGNTNSKSNFLRFEFVGN